jgi:tetratricopeptide (TPR) repeat protein
MNYQIGLILKKSFEFVYLMRSQPSLSVPACKICLHQRLYFSCCMIIAGFLLPTHSAIACMSEGNSFNSFYLIITASAIILFSLLAMAIKIAFFRKLTPCKNNSTNLLSEANIYLAYGQKEKARTILQEAFANDPENKEILEKLRTITKT